MSKIQGYNADQPAFSTQKLVPRIEKFGTKSIEVTYLGENADGHATWILWNSNEPYLLGMLIQGRLGFTFEQRTSEGVMLHRDVSLARIQRALAG